MSAAKQPNARDVVAEFLRQVDEGFEVSQEEVLAKHPRISSELKQEFDKLNALSDAVAKAGTTPETPAASGFSTRTIIRCPHCNKPVDATLTESLRLFACGECNNEFSLVRDRKWPSRINHFELVERIGMGGFGTVWKARDVELDRFVALKLPRRTHPDGTEAEQFMQEARTAANLNHPNIVSVLEVGAFEGEVYIASELIDGDSLSKRIGNGLTESETLDVAEQLAQALAYAHSEGVIHRDLKPQNVILDRSGKPYLSDFGLAGQVASDVSLTVTGQVLGTPNYMSPEQARGQSVDERSDIYSFGVLLYETLTGQVPFQGTLPNVLRRLESEDPIGPRKINDRLSRDLDTICMKCLEKNRDRRYQSAQEVVSELQRVITGKPILARPVGPFEQLSRWSKRNPALAMLSGIAACAILFVGVLLNSLSAQRVISAVESRHTTLAQMKEVLAEAKGGYRTRIFDLLRNHPEMIDDDTFHDAVRDVAIRSMGDFAGYAPLPLDLKDDASTVAISSDGSLLAIAYVNVVKKGKESRVEIRRTSSINKVLYSFSSEDSLFDHPISLRFPNTSNHQLITLSQQGVLARSDWSSGAVKSKTIAKMRELPINEGSESFNEIIAGAISLDGTRVAFCDDTDTVSIFDMNSLEMVFSERVNNLGDAELKNVAISEDKQYVAAGYEDTAGSIGGLVRWDLTDGSFLDMPLNMGGRYENGLAFDGSNYIGVGGEQTTQYEVVSMEVRQSFEGSESAALAYSPNGTYLAICYGTGEIEIRHRKSQTAIAHLAYENSGAGRIGAAFSRQGRHLVVWNESGLQVVDFEGCSERLELVGHRRGIPAVRFADDGETLISSGKNGLVRKWDLSTRELESEIDLLSQVQCVVLSPNEKLMATANWGKDAKLSIWTYPELKLVCHVDNDLGNICGLEFSPSGKFLAANGDYGLKVWKTGVAENHYKFEPFYEESFDNGKFLTFSPNGERLFQATQWSRIAWVEMSTKAAHSFSDDRSLLLGFNSMAFTKDRRLTFVNPEGGLQVLDFTSSEEPQSKVKLPDGTFAASSVTISKQGLLAGLTEGSTVSIWDLDREKQLYEFRPEANVVWSLAWSPDGNRLAVGLSDGGLAVWDLREIRKQLEELGFDQ